MASEKCAYAYRLPKINAVMCSQIKGDSPYCGHQYLCSASQRWEANPNVRCSFREKGQEAKEE